MGEDDLDNVEEVLDHASQGRGSGDQGWGRASRGRPSTDRAAKAPSVVSPTVVLERRPLMSGWRASTLDSLNGIRGSMV